MLRHVLFYGIKGKIILNEHSFSGRIINLGEDTRRIKICLISYRDNTLKVIIEGNRRRINDSREEIFRKKYIVGMELL